MKYILCILLVLGLTLPAFAAEVKDVENFVTENFTLKQDEAPLAAAIRLLGKLKEIRPERETQETSTVEKGKNGRERQVYETRFVDTGEMVSKRIEATEYDKNGVIKEVLQEWFDKDSKLVKHRIIKYIHGQPKVSEINIEPIPIER